MSRITWVDFWRYMYHIFDSLGEVCRLKMVEAHDKRDNIKEKEG
jgi:hypothetical protein